MKPNRREKSKWKCVKLYRYCVECDQLYQVSVLPFGLRVWSFGTEFQAILIKPIRSLSSGVCAFLTRNHFMNMKIVRFSLVCIGIAAEYKLDMSVFEISQYLLCFTVKWLAQSHACDLYAKPMNGWPNEIPLHYRINCFEIGNVPRQLLAISV